MSDTGSRHWLIAYDIRCSRRLRAVHRILKREAMALQYSAFLFHGTELRLSWLLRTVEGRIRLLEDDVRAYFVPPRTAVWLMGRQSLPDGVFLSPNVVTSLLTEILRQSVGRADMSREGEALEAME